MSEKHFIALWFSPNCQGAWTDSPSTLYWARSYNMDEGLLRMMSRDLMSIPGYDKKKNSATNLARHILREKHGD